MSFKGQEFVIEEVQPGSTSKYTECERLLGMSSTSFATTIAGYDEASDEVIGACGLSATEDLLTLTTSISNEESERKPNFLVKLVDKAVEVAAERFPDHIVLALPSSTATCSDYENLGFLHIDDDKKLFLWPADYMSLESFCCNEKSSGDFEHSDGVQALLGRIKDQKFVPLTYLRRRLDIEKIGRSIVHTYVEVAKEIEKLQNGKVCPEGLQRALKNEAFILDFAWERLNTGHYSEVDDCWRTLFACASLLKAVRLEQAGQLMSSMSAVDFGLLMGGCSLDLPLQRYAQHLLECLPPAPSISNKASDIVFSVPRSLPNSIAIESYDNLTKWEFADRFLNKKKPVIVRGLNKHWPALKKWSFEYLHSILCYRVVPVELGSSYTENEWSQKLMTGSEFFNSVGNTENGPLYLAQHRLFEQIPQLCEDFSLPHYCDHCEEKNVDRNSWIGPGGTLSPLHTDPRDNLFCQIKGRKFLRLVAPEDSENVYAFQDGIITNTSQVDVLNPDLEKFPNFGNARCWDGVVGPGDVLFIPKGWWHLVSSLSNSISISFWFDFQ
ncbi:hypothetical protein Q1695_014290 [Nippostrongylus brasiliensis]|nr:hypothetical protein Q1695_014290 [Nippostrongylus brasiliensis]